jgi:CO/xanthine dehydrogenase Mo-binding subunit
VYAGGFGLGELAGRPPHAENLIAQREDRVMAKKRGRGVAAVNYPTGMNLGGDPTQALVHATTTGNFVVSLSSVDLGQGMKSIIAQICAETLGVPTERVIIDTADSDTGPHCMGTFASRGTHRIGNAVIAAAKEARGVMMEVAADLLEADPADLRADGMGNVHVVGAPGVSVSVTDVALAAHFQKGRSIAGRGMFFIPRSFPSPTDGAMKPSTCYAHACAITEVEVDTETGEVDVLSLKCVYEVGRALNPKIVEQQLVGGAWMAMSHALYETTEPYYPARDQPRISTSISCPALATCPKSRYASSNDRRRTALTAQRASARCVQMCQYRPSRMQFLTPLACVSTACRCLPRRSCARFRPAEHKQRPS